MYNHNRIRLDAYGLILQNQRGRLDRLKLDAEMVREVSSDPQSTLAFYSQRFSVLKEFLADGQLDARLDVCLEDTGSLNRPLRVYYGIEPRCDLGCSFCGPRRLSGNLATPPQETEQFLLKQIADSGAFQVQLTGGEIGMRGYDLLTTVERTRELGLAVLLSTNGVWRCIDNKDDFLRRLADFGNVIQSKISIEGTPEFHESKRGKDTYYQTLDTLAKLSEFGLNPRISATIFKSSCNSEQLEHLVGLALKYSAGLQPIPLRPIGRAYALRDEVPTKEALLEYTRHATRLRQETGVQISFNFDIFEGGRQVPAYDPQSEMSCGAPLWGVHVTHTGEVYPCGFVQEADEKNSFCAGVISPQHSLLHIWRNSELLKRVRAAGKSYECRGCEHYGKGCWGGCWVVAWVATGSLSGMDPYCPKSFAQFPEWTSHKPAANESLAFLLETQMP